MGVRLGFIGTGGIAGAHFDCLATIPQATVAAVFDVNRAAAERAAARHPGCRVYDDAHELIATADVDAMYVCVPPFAHEDYEIAIAERGLPLLVEKPVSLTMPEARRAAATIERAGVLNAAGYHWRYQPLIDRAREILGDRPIGLIRGHFIGGLPGTPWWRVKAQSGGQIVEQTTHIFDLARHFGGEVVSVYAQAARGLMTEVESYDIEDASTVTLRFASGAIGSISSADIAPGYGSGIEIVSRDLTLQITGGSLKALRVRHVEEFTENVRPHPHVLEDRAFVSAVERGDASLIRSTFIDGVRTLEVTLAANQSLETGEVVHLPLP
ncbi:MAG: Gfo/Idh/MocA family oxidoreductase [Chloroflexi bacterium]|nr:Gfo/Idh/MocA family oxidoreductase [Chloroflexota bacterium]